MELWHTPTHTLVRAAETDTPTQAGDPEQGCRPGASSPEGQSNSPWDHLSGASLACLPRIVAGPRHPQSVPDSHRALGLSPRAYAAP